MLSSMLTHWNQAVVNYVTTALAYGLSPVIGAKSLYEIILDRN